MKESTENVVHLPCVEPDSMNVILDYAYNGKIDLAKEDVLKIIVLANYFMCEVLIHQCCNFIRQFTTVYNCARILQFALNYDINQLKESTKLYIIDHIKNIYEVNLEFHELPVDLMMDVVQHPAAVICPSSPVENEKQLFALLWRKISRLPEDQQKEYIPKILKSVHLPVVGEDYLALLEKKVGHIEGIEDVIEAASMARKTVDARESREWYLPRHKSSNIELNLIERDTPLQIDDKKYDTKHYSSRVLINGVSLVAYGAEEKGSYVINIDDSAGLDNQYKITAMCHNETYTTYCKGNVERNRNFAISK